jgi:hypothetical protein
MIRQSCCLRTSLAYSPCLARSWLTGWAVSVRRSMARVEALPSLRLNLALQPVYGIALVTIVACGVYPGRQYGVLGAGWVLASYGGLLLSGISGGIARPQIRLSRQALEDPSDRVFLALRSAANHSNLPVSLHTRVALALALVYLMIGQPEVGTAIGVIGLSVALAFVTSLTSSRTSSAAVRSPLHWSES